MTRWNQLLRTFCKPHNTCRNVSHFTRVLPASMVSCKPSSEEITAYEQNLTKLKSFTERALQGGGPRAIERHVKLNKKVLIRERLQMLLDPGAPFIEIGHIAGFEQEYGDVPAGGLVIGIGRVNGIYCLVGGNDATVKGGSYFPITVKKGSRTQELAFLNSLPSIYLPDSGGAYLPAQADIFPDRNHGGRHFYNQAILSSLGVAQISVVCGSCTAGGAYNPTMTDESIIIDKVGKIFLGGPPLVRAALGEIITDEELGGAWLHSSVSGYSDYFARGEKEAFDMCRDVVQSLGLVPVNSTTNFQLPLHHIESWTDLAAKKHLPKEDVYVLLAGILDGSSWKEFKEFYGQGIITGWGYIEGMLVGIVCNITAIGPDEGVKASHFIDMCCRRKTPLIFLQNSSISEIQEYDGLLLKSRSKMSAALAAADVPKIALTLTACLEDDHLTMCGPSFLPNMHLMWPSARMSSLQMHYDPEKNVVDSLTAAHNLLTDAVIHPQNTRNVLAETLRMFQQQRLNPLNSTAIRPVFRM